MPKPLAVAFNTLTASALKTNEKATVKGVHINSGGLTATVTLSVSPLMVKKGEQKLLMLTFMDEGTMATQPGDSVFNDKIYLDQYTLNIEEELKGLKEKLNSAY